MGRRTTEITAGDIERFWSKVDKSGGVDACWPWLAGKDKDGYGKFQYGPNGGQTHFRAHIFAFLVTHGRRPVGVTRHECDNPPCCNPGLGHLSEGTQKENRADCIARGREPRGEGKARAKLTESAVIDIRTSNDRCIDLAAKYGVSHGLISHVRKRLIWRHVL